MKDVIKTLYQNGEISVEGLSKALKLGWVKKEEFEELIKNDIEQLKQTKISELSAICEQTIYKGLELELSEGKEHFEYKEKDQINIKAMFDAVIFGAEKYPYQSETGVCRIFIKEDIVKLYSSLETLRTSQLTYYNQLKKYVNTLENIEEINAVIYGQELTGEYLEHYNEMMVIAQEQMQLVLSKIIN